LSTFEDANSLKFPYLAESLRISNNIVSFFIGCQNSSQVSGIFGKNGRRDGKCAQKCENKSSLLRSHHCMCFTMKLECVSVAISSDVDLPKI